MNTIAAIIIYIIPTAIAIFVTFVNLRMIQKYDKHLKSMFINQDRFVTKLLVLISQKCSKEEIEKLLEEINE